MLCIIVTVIITVVGIILGTIRFYYVFHMYPEKSYKSAQKIHSALHCIGREENNENIHLTFREQFPKSWYS